MSDKIECAPSIQSELGEGYVFVDKNSVAPEEIIALRESVHWDGRAAEGWQEFIDQPLSVLVGVRDAQNILVGMGCLSSGPFHAVLCDLAVAPEHQRQGIGEAVLRERIRIADEMKTLYLYTNLAPTNPFYQKSKELGFIATGGELFRIKPD